MNFSLSNGFIGVDLGHCLLYAGEAGGGLLRRLLGLCSTVSGIKRVSVGIIGLAHRITNAFGCARVDVGNHLGVLGREFIQLVDAATNRIKLPGNILFAGKGVQLAPETFVTFILQGLVTSGLIGGLRLLRLLALYLIGWRLLVRRVIGILCCRGNYEGGGAWKGQAARLLYCGNSSEPGSEHCRAALAMARTSL